MDWPDLPFPQSMFVQGKLYRRRDLHHQHGGQSQGGISTPANQNFIFIFTGEQGEQYGYSDSWTDDGIRGVPFFL